MDNPTILTKQIKCTYLVFFYINIKNTDDSQQITLNCIITYYILTIQFQLLYTVYTNFITIKPIGKILYSPDMFVNQQWRCF